MQEIEATLVAAYPRPQSVLTDIAELTGIEEYAFLPKGEHWIRDYYLDTSDRALAGQRLALRVRKIGKQQWLTLKGAARIKDDHAVERLEIEDLWSTTGVQRIRGELAHRGIKLPDYGPAVSRNDALDITRDLGLVIIHNHTTYRQLRNVIPSRRAGAHMVAELAIDHVFYEFDGIEYRHCEVEIEATATPSDKALGAITRALIARYHPALRTWYHSKLATGLAVQELLGNGDLAEARDNEGYIRPWAYEKIDRYLTRATDTGGV